MIRNEFSVYGLQSLIQGIDAKKATGRQIRNVIRKNGSDLQREAQKRMTKSVAYTKGYSNGDTRRSTTLEITDGGMTAIVAPNTEYFLYIEYGTRKMEAEPALRPAFEFVLSSFVKDVKELMNER